MVNGHELPLTKADVGIATGSCPQSPHKNYAHPFT